MVSSEEPTKKKGTVKTEALIGTGVKRIEAALKSLEAANKNFNELPKTLSELSAQVADKQDKINALATEYAEKKRAAEVNLALEVKSSKEEVVNKVLGEAGKLAVNEEEYLALVAKLAQSETTQKSAVDAAVAIATNSLKKHHESELQVREAQYNAKEADNKAQIGSLQKEVATLTKELESWKNQLAEERKASVERARASAIGAVNISGPGK